MGRRTVVLSLGQMERAGFMAGLYRVSAELCPSSQKVRGGCRFSGKRHTDRLYKVYRLFGRKPAGAQPAAAQPPPLALGGWAFFLLVGKKDFSKKVCTLCTVCPCAVFHEAEDKTPPFCDDGQSPTPNSVHSRLTTKRLAEQEQTAHGVVRVAVRPDARVHSAQHLRELDLPQRLLVHRRIRGCIGAEQRL
jgi:hypothetical protein